MLFILSRTRVVNDKNWPITIVVSNTFSLSKDQGNQTHRDQRVKIFLMKHFSTLIECMFLHIFIDIIIHIITSKERTAIF